MIVRNTGDSWQLVAQPDHGDVCGLIVQAWGNPDFSKSAAPSSLNIAARRHDDGWAVWERTPDVDRLAGDGRPLNVFDIGIEIHLAFFNAMLVAVSDEDAYAGVLASMHAAGLYTQRYGTDHSLRMTMQETKRDAIRAFVDERNRSHDSRARELGIDDAQRWTDYKLLQFADRLCLYLCLSDLAQGAEAVISSVPADQDTDTAIQLRPAGPWRVSLDPYPLTEPLVALSLPHRILPKRQWNSREEFAGAYHAAPVEQQVISLVKGGIS